MVNVRLKAFVTISLLVAFGQILFGRVADAQTWETTTLVTGVVGLAITDQRAGTNSSIALDSAGNPVIAYQRLIELGPATETYNESPFYIRFSNGSWNSSSIFSGIELGDDLVGERIGVAIDSTDRAYFLLLRDLSDTPTLGYFDRALSSGASTWDGDILEGGDRSRWFDFGVGTSGPQVVFPRGSDSLTCDGVTVGSNRLVHSWMVDGAWRCRLVTGAGTAAVAGPMAFDIDQAGAAHLLYSFRHNPAPADATAEHPDAPHPDIRYRKSTVQDASGNYSWSAEGFIMSVNLGFTSGSGVDPAAIHMSLDTDNNNQAHMCAYSPATGRLLYLRYVSSSNSLSFATLDGTSGLIDAADPTDVGRFCDIAVDRNAARLHVSYYDAQNQKLKYVTKLISEPNSARVRSDIDDPASGDVGQYSSIAVDAEGFAHISYYDAGTGSLKYATNRPPCGNRMIGSGEQCDDGNTTAGDGCSATCQIEAAVCGNGSCETGETNANCASDCPAVCGNGTCETGEDSVTCPADCPTVCGNGSCETGENNANCSADCGTTCGDGTCQTNENDVTCPADCRSVCGNGTCETGENNTNCSQDCLPSCGNGACDGAETNATCPADCAAVCGNQICEGGESNQNCPADCAVSCGDSVCGTGETNATCPRDCPAVCGNRIQEGTEQCDDGNTTSGDNCSATCQTEGGGGAVCGNNRKEGDEQCDDGNMNSGDGCSATCRTEEAGPVCGNRVVEAGEECDDGNVTVGDGCNASCKKDSGTGITETETIVPPPGRPTRGGCSLIL